MGLSTTTWQASVRSLLAQGQPSFWLPPRASTTADPVDQVFYLVLYISIFFFALIVTLMTVFVVRYRRRPDRGPEASPAHHTGLEVVWSVIPLGIVIYIFYAGFVGFLDLRTPPADAYPIEVVARQFQWDFRYPNGAEDENLHVPVNRPVLLTMRSEDVIHSLSIPAFRVKMDVVPGRYTQMWFHATEPGIYDFFCTEYCGTGHSLMGGSVVVHRPGEFEQWLAGAADYFDRLTPVEAGQFLFNRHGCVQCHSIDGSRALGGGPTLLGAFGAQRRLSDGRTVTVDENYIRDAILDPASTMVEGYPAGVMPTFRGRLSDQEVTYLIEFIKTLEP